jgi:hypothetical protein
MTKWAEMFLCSVNNERNKMKIKSVLMAFLMSGTAHAGTYQELKEIGENANVGNGDYSLSKYSPTRFDKAASITNLKKLRFSGCSWSVIEYRRDAIDEIKSFASDDSTAEALTILYQEKKIKSILALQSDNEEACSRLYVKIYTNDGYVLQINYDHST